MPNLTWWRRRVAVLVTLGVILGLIAPAAAQTEAAPLAGFVKAAPGDHLGAVFPGTAIAARAALAPGTALDLLHLPGLTVAAVGSGTVEVIGPVEAVRRLLDDPAVIRLDLIPAPTEEVVRSEGIPLMGVDVLHLDGQDGSGTTIAVVDAGFSGYQALLGSELPAAVTIRNMSVTGFESSPHGTAVAELIHDVAPGAALHLIAIDGSNDLGAVADYVIGAGIDVVNMSLGFKTGPFDGSSYVSRQAQRAVDAGVVWVSSAGNYGNAHWGGLFTDPGADGTHDWVPGDEDNSFWVGGGDTFYIDLAWVDPATDYDICLLRWGIVTQCATSSNSPGAPLVERIVWDEPFGASYSVSVIKYSGPTGYFDVFFHSTDNLEHRVAERSVVSPADATGVIAVGAVDWATPTVIESFSSRGPTYDGRVKPDLVSTDFVSTDTYGFRAFGGTSASSPHVAGLAALYVAAYPTLTPAQIRDALAADAQDLGALGDDNTFGAGFARAAEPPRCDGLPATLLGTPFDDVLTGTAGRDVIIGLGGDDTIAGGEGDDLICAGPGDDTVLGDRNPDFEGEEVVGGIDTIYGDEGDDRLFGQGGADLIFGNQGNDQIFGGADRDLLYGGPDQDIIDGGGGDDEIWGGPGHDVDPSWEPGTSGIAPQKGEVAGLSGGPGNDKIYGEGGRDHLFGGGGDDLLDGGPQNDRLFGDAGDDTLLGGGGNDEIKGKAGNDTADGGEGINTVIGGYNTDVCINGPIFWSCDAPATRVVLGGTPPAGLAEAMEFLAAWIGDPATNPRPPMSDDLAAAFGAIDRWWVLTPVSFVAAWAAAVDGVQTAVVHQAWWRRRAEPGGYDILLWRNDGSGWELTAAQLDRYGIDALDGASPYDVCTWAGTLDECIGYG